ncbi:hypothetical protein EUGRSUZ_C03146 [Eucalyptus grandis]|uniref:Uncharacterized protein n=1 Tax=Eucalyptus grandis TaxID=71139 RepID=A0ACC3LIC6_EUCGR|nr:hypothetical protein EUGRSUZ_C03146 [Eucalyptus grandis]
MDGGAQYNPRTVEEVFRDFKGRRAGMIKALTTEVEEFYQQCDPENENLCLYGFPSEQKRLFNMINDLPTIFEVVTGTAKKQVKEKSSITNNSSSKSKSNPKKVSESQTKYTKAVQPKEEEEEGLEEEDEEEHGETLCGACGENYASDEFWICCDICEKWFHGKCVKITPARAEHIKQYKCPSCSNKRSRP